MLTVAHASGSVLTSHRLHPTEDLRSQGAFRDNSEIGELICDHCLAPCDHAEENIGHDNVTIVIVAPGLLHGRTKEAQLDSSSGNELWI